MWYRARFYASSHSPTTSHILGPILTLASTFQACIFDRRVSFSQFPTPLTATFMTLLKLVYLGGKLTLVRQTLTRANYLLHFTTTFSSPTSQLVSPETWLLMGNNTSLLRPEDFHDPTYSIPNTFGALEMFRGQRWHKMYHILSRCLLVTYLHSFHQFGERSENSKIIGRQIWKTNLSLQGCLIFLRIKLHEYRIKMFNI